MKINWRYTLGEILIVFVGISMAFALERWSENSKESNLKQQYISNIKNDIVEDRAILATNLDSISSKIKTGASIIPILDSEMANGIKMESLGKIFNFISTIEFIPNDNTYNALINSGDYNIIDNFELKKAIEGHYSNYEILLKDISRIEAIKKEYIGDYLINHIDYDAIRQGQFGFEDEKLFKNIVSSMTGAYQINQLSTRNALNSCDSLIAILDKEL